MERKLLDMMNQLSISEYNPRMKYCDKFQICRCKKVKTEYRADDGINKLYESYSAPWYTEALLYIAVSLFVIVVCFMLRVIIGRKMKKR